MSIVQYNTTNATVEGAQVVKTEKDLREAYAKRRGIKAYNGPVKVEFFDGVPVGAQIVVKSSRHATPFWYIWTGDFAQSMETRDMTQAEAQSADCASLLALPRVSKAELARRQTTAQLARTRTLLRHINIERRRTARMQGEANAVQSLAGALIEGVSERLTVNYMPTQQVKSAEFFASAVAFALRSTQNQPPHDDNGDVENVA